MLVHRLIDVFFKALDIADATRDQIDRVLGREQESDPWAVPWDDNTHSDQPTSEQSDFQKGPPAEEAGVEATKAAPTDSAPASSPKKKQTAKGKKTTTTSKKSSARTKKVPGRKKSSTSKRKGSVDRSGKDVDSARARAIATHVVENGLPVVLADHEIEGKKVLARVVWALWAASQAGGKKGLTTKDISALLSTCAEMEVYTTNIGRACRDHTELIEPNEPDGRSKRYSLSAQGERAARLFTQA